MTRVGAGLVTFAPTLAQLESSGWPELAPLLGVIVHSFRGGPPKSCAEKTSRGARHLCYGSSEQAVLAFHGCVPADAEPAGPTGRRGGGPHPSGMSPTTTTWITTVALQGESRREGA